MIGERLREVRQSQGRSLADVAGKANISVATLSRIETDKQSIDVSLLIELTAVLGVAAADMLSTSDNGNGSSPAPLVQRIAGLDARKRTELWRELAGERRAQRASGRSPRNIGQEVDELLAQIDFLREELESVRARIKKR
jgi:transcriptional regulator with XRE-family HTH domain